jgi:glycosyltransferase involved in cell wall biosynthesis
VGGTGEAVRHGETGLLVPPRDADAFAGALTTLLEDDARRTALGAAGRDWAVQEFDSVRWAHRLREIYEQTPSRASSRSLAALGK